MPELDMTRSFLPDCDTQQTGQDRSGRRTSSKEGKPTARKAHGDAGQDVGRSECRSVADRIRVLDLPGAKASPRPTGEPSRENLENRLDKGKRKKAERTCAPLEFITSTGGCRCVSRRLFEGLCPCCRASRTRHSWRGCGMMDRQHEWTKNSRAGQPAFGELEPYAGKLARTVLRGAWGRKRPLAYSTADMKPLTESETAP